MSDTKSQETLILEYLKEGWRLTPLVALDMFGCFRLGARIFSLRKAGHNIQSSFVKTPGGKFVSEYRLEA